MALDFQDALDDVIDTSMPISAYEVGDPGQTLDAVLTRANNYVSAKQRRWSNPRYVRRIRETAQVIKRSLKGDLPMIYLHETLSTSDFPILFGDIVDRQLLQLYNTAPAVWRQYLRAGTVRDFRQVRRIALDGLDASWVNARFKKPELTGVVYDNNLAESEYTTSVDIYERGYSFNWRMIINDDLDFLGTFGPRIQRGAQRTESRLAVGIYVTSTGPNNTFFSNTNKNLINTTNGATSNNPVLSVQGLRDAINVMARQVDSGGEPIYIEAVILVVPPSLEITALEIVNAVQLEIVPATSAIGTRYATANWIKSRLTVVVDPYLPIVDASANKYTTWYVFASPNGGRPAAEVTFLRGYETPQVFQKAPNTMRVGGAIDPMMGDFETMEYRFKGMHIVGGALFDPKLAAVSNGSAA